MGESRGSKSGGAAGERLIAAIHPSAGLESVDPPLAFGDDDEMGPFKVAEVGKPEPPAPWWGKYLSGRSSAIGVGVAAGFVLTVTALFAARRADSASEIGSVLLPSGWVGSGGVDSTDGGVDSSGGRSTFSRLFFGGDTDEEEAATAEGSTAEAVDSDADLADDGDADGADVERPDESSEAAADDDGELAGGDDSPATSTPDSTSSTSVDSEDAAPTSSVGSTTRPPSTSSSAPSSSTPSATSTTTRPTTTTTTTSTTITTTTVVSVAAPTGCEVADATPLHRPDPRTEHWSVQRVRMNFTE